MTRRADTVLSRAELRAATGVLLVLREPLPATVPVPGQPAAVGANPAEGAEVLLAVWDDGSVTALNGHVDLGTGIRTALSQIVAEELDVAMDSIHMVLGDTARAPNQGATIASASIQLHAEPLRRAAAQARAWLGRRGAAGIGGALAGQHVELMLDLTTPVKDPKDYRVVGQSVPRVDMLDKLTGELVFVHDMRLPGMLHGRVVRPPYAGADHGDFIGNTLESVDEGSIAHIPGIRAVVVIRDFVGIVAEREEQAEQALADLQVRWKPWPGMPDQQDVAQAIRDNPRTTRQLVDEGDVDAALAGAAESMPRTYLWPYQMHASIGPSCAVADWQGASLKVWAGTQNPHVLRFDLSRLMGLPDIAIDVVRMEAAGCYGRNGADDVAADAALLSRAVGAPVRVQLTRAQEHLWEPKGTAQLMEVRGGLNADGSAAGYDFQTSYPSNGAPTLALLLTRSIEPVAQAFEMGDRTARPPYSFENLRVRVHDMAPIVRSSWLRGVSALPNAFAHESYIDELATAAGADPVDYRLRHLDDPRAAELVRATAQKAGWKPHTAPQRQAADGDWLQGQGFAYARYIHSKWPGYGAAWAAWVADVDVNRKTGEVHVRRVVVGHDAGLMVNPAGVEHQVHGNVLQTTSRALKEEVRFTPGSNVVANAEWGSYPILSFREVPVVEVLHMPRPGEPALGAGESASVPGTAAIANAIFDATGVRFRAPPFTPEVVRAALNVPPEQAGTALAAIQSGAYRNQDGDRSALAGLPLPKGRTAWATAGAVLAGVIGLGTALFGGRTALAPITAGTASVYTDATIERGRQLAAVGNCVGCHTTAGGVPNAGGRAMHTPFGTVYTTNLTPDPDTGIGRWSLAAFQRAMREGISRDGHHLYPAFPYTAFAKTSDEDLTALYAYLMAQPAVSAATKPAEMSFPYSQRALMVGWNALFHDATPYRAEPQQSAEWNRGAYLVNGLGHCGACHTPRNALGAEQGGQAYLAGALVDGWEAPALTALSRSPVPWSADALYRYLRHGHAAEHGAAGGPMARVVRELAALPDTDVRAMASYLASFQSASPVDAKAVVQQAAQAGQALPNASQRLFDGACGACHHDGDGPRLLGLNLPLALSSKLHSDHPDNLLRTILDGVQEPAGRDVGFMPAFRHNLSDAQVAEIAGYMRQRFAPGKPNWADLPEAVARVRALPH
ncbi:aldehyde dehydrogenase [Rhodoferax koreense]|uniref:Aldehyde dehydrogenase n=1 Tax=Rhodoferax koreensis TaxID=1842727 RepID=A0A1P8K1N3_9BURK|nr:molybdopterin cofactor-binding domain-containing protein [Rhodoferax koreense]APW39918.1 aldehyde dehydrogenase [Rhodoferax koreense]